MPIFAILAAATTLCVGSVHDGDTIRTCEGERIRIENIDAPEMRGSPKCNDRRRNGWCDYPLALQSRDALAAFLAKGHAKILRSGKDRYGRTLATIAVRGRDAGEYLIAQGLARPWR
jgi:micrococcal nuclease